MGGGSSGLFSTRKVGRGGLNGGEDLLGSGFKQIEIGFVPDCGGLCGIFSGWDLRNRDEGGYLDHFSHSIGEFPGGKGLEESGIDKDVFWLPECTDQVFAMGGIDRGFASDA